MSEHTTLWTPDTCDCTVAFAWDDAVPATERVHNFVRRERSCAVHAPAFGTARTGANARAAYAAVLEENQRKNLGLGLLQAEHGIDPEQVAWTFDAARNVTFTLPPEHAGQAAAITASLAARFGPGKAKAR